MAKQNLSIKDDRLSKLSELRKLGVNPYPSKVIFELEKISEARGKLGKEVSVAGRIFGWRAHGGIIFADLKDQSGDIQIWFQESNLRKEFDVVKLFDIGDFLAVNGEVVKTKAGEITVNVFKFQLLSKSLKAIPSKWHGLKDVEERFRKRYLDLLLNPEVKKRFETRTLIVKEIRRYLDNLGFQEVETPALQPLYGGANAKPFKTHVNMLDVDMYLRIADELYLKRLIAGGYEKVYEICKDFRNEGLDLTHQPEFTMIEYYEAYADYHRVMDVTEGLFKHLAQAIFGKMELNVGDKAIDVSHKWPRIRMVDIIKEELKLDVMKESRESLEKYCVQKKIELVGGESRGQLIFSIFDHQITDSLVEPTWIIDYPKEVSPLSKDKEGEPGFVERFEGYIGGKEICDGWSELTDPQEQRSRFESDTKAARKDKEEAQQVDENFLEAMEYGMPPIGGIGIGIDRLTMFFTNTWSIKEVILYPLMRPETRIQVGKYDYRSRKIVAIVNEDLPEGIAANSLGHLAFSAGHYSGNDWMGKKDLIDASGSVHAGISRYPFVVLETSISEIKKISEGAKKDGIFVVDYLQEMFDTGSDEELIKAVSKSSDLKYQAIILVGDSETIEKYTKKLRLYGKVK